MMCRNLGPCLRGARAVHRDESFRAQLFTSNQRIFKMLKSVRTRAEGKFAKIKQQEKKFVKEKEKAEQERLAKSEHLRALRLARDAAEKEAAEQEAAKGTAGKS
jgi:hypothetical protein